VTTFVLVHGAYHGGWCWYEVATELEARGHKAVTLDLPAHGVDGTPVEAVTLEDYTARVAEALASTDGKTVLVGHSMAGMVVTQIAEDHPEWVDTLVYLTAYLPGDGESMLDQREPGSLISRHFNVDEERGVGWVDPDALREVFYADVPDARFRLACDLVRPEPMGPLKTPVSTSEANWGRIRRIYVRCEEDRAITASQQDTMLDRRGADEVFSLEASHSPFLSMPTETVGLLEAATDRG
jgi:pimeloyl-ACP methyl ester carboxylesterase